MSAPAAPVAPVALGIVGHVDHGKTALVRALTGTETDRLADEKRRGISIVLGFAALDGPDGPVDLVDMPGHERFVRTMVAGATGIAAIVLAIAADDGVKPQTVEHVEIAALLGIADAVLVVTRTDLADPSTVASVADAARALLGRNGIATRATHPVSALTGDGIDALRATLRAVRSLLPSPPSPGIGAADGTDDGWAFLPVDRAFTIGGSGTVVTGTLRRGTVRPGDELHAFVPGAAPDRPRRVRVRGLELRGMPAGIALPGGRTAINLRAVEPPAVPRGTVLATPDALHPESRLLVALRHASGGPTLATGTRFLVLAGTDEVEGRVRLLDADALDEGAHGFAELALARPLAIPVGERFVLRVASPPRTVGGGVVILHGTTRPRRRHAPTLARLARLASASPAERVADALAVAGNAGTTLAALGRAAGLAPPRVGAMLAGSGAVIARRGGAVIGAAAWERLLARVPGLVEAGTMPSLPDGLRDELVATLLARGVLRRDGNRLVRQDAKRDAARALTEDAIARALLARVGAAGLAPPPIGELAPDPATRRVLDRLVRSGALVRATDRVQKRDWVFGHDAIADARRRLAVALDARADGMAVGELGAVLGLTRRHAVPLLEHLDAVRFTRRCGDRRVRAAAP